MRIAAVPGAPEVRCVRFFEMHQVLEPERGTLAVGEFGRDFPIVPRRFFLTYQVPEGKTRGNHAHRRCEQVLICAHGTCHFRVDDGEHGADLILDRPARAVLIPPLVWVAEKWRSPGSVLLVFASRDYEPEDYIRDYEEFRTLAGSQRDG